MKIAGLLNRFARNKTALDVDEELRFHVEMLERKYKQHGMSTSEAKTAAAKRFGNVERVKRQCVAISRRNSLPQRMLKTITILIALTGLSIRILSTEYRVARIGHVLIVIAVCARLLIYVRGLSPTPRNYEKPECW